MTGDTKAGVAQATLWPYRLCDLARTSQEFAVIDLASGEIAELTTEADARALVKLRYPDARLLLTTGRSVVEDRDLGLFVVLMVLQPTLTQGQASSQTWRPVAYVGGASHGSLCIPLSPEVWPEAIDGIGFSSRPPEERLVRCSETLDSSSGSEPSIQGSDADVTPRHDTSRTMDASWRPRVTPHAYRERPPGAEWPLGPHGQTCADCGLDPRNLIHKV